MLDQTTPPSDSTRDFVHVGPDTLAGRYLRRYWQPICPGREIEKARPKAVRLLGEDFTVYRGKSGRAHVLDFLCPHRRAQLWLGQIEGDDIRCFYHGWKFDCSGQCIEQPAEDTDSARGVRIGSYPTQEYLGLIFVYIGPGEPPPMPRFSFHEEPGRQFLLVSHKVAYNYFQDIENLVDPVHAAFAHASFFDKTGAPRAPVQVEQSSWGITVSRAGVGQGVSHLGMPNMFQISGALATPGAHSTVWIVPTDDENHRFYSVRSMPAATATATFNGSNAPSPDPEMLSALAQRILGGEGRIEDYEAKLLPFQYQLLQDFVVQGSQGIVADRSKEKLGKSDKAIALLRRLWRKEMEAVAAGQPLTEWKWSAELLNEGEWSWKQDGH